MLFQPRYIPEGPSQWLAYILTTVRNVLGGHIRQGGANAALLDYAFGRLLRMQHAFNALVLRAMAGKVTVRRAPRAAERVPGDEPAARNPRAKPAFVLPRVRGWMLRIVEADRHWLTAAAADLRAMCAAPTVAPLLEQHPALRRMLRSMHVMLSPEAYPAELRRPHEPAVIRQRPQRVKRPSAREFLRALRTDTPYKGFLLAYNRVMTPEELVAFGTTAPAKIC